MIDKSFIWKKDKFNENHLFRKLSNTSTKSRDFPPSYSQADLHTLAMSVHDYLYPPPQYPDLHRYTIHGYPPPSRNLDLHRYTIHGYPLPSQYPDLHRYTIHGYPPPLNIQIYIGIQYVYPPYPYLHSNTIH